MFRYRDPEIVEKELYALSFLSMALVYILYLL